MKKSKEKISALFLSLLIIAILIVSCEKDSDDSEIPGVGDAKPVAWAVGSQDNTNHAAVFYSADSGNTWVRQGANSNALLDFDAMNLFVVDTNNIWIVGTGRSIVRTTDGGDTWYKVNPPDVGPDIIFNCISVVNDDIWISGGTSNTGVVCKSADDGMIWTLQDTALFGNYLMQGILAINSQVIYAVGNNSGSPWLGKICRTLDGGITWDSVHLTDNYNKRVSWIGVAATDENHVVVYGQTNHYAYTTNGGLSWTNDSAVFGSTGTADINHLVMLEDLTWWAALDMGNILKTLDAGNSWEYQGASGSGSMYLMGIDAYDNNLAIVTGQSLNWPVSGNILQTKDGGNTWVERKNTDFWMEKVAFAPH